MPDSARPSLHCSPPETQGGAEGRMGGGGLRRVAHLQELIILMPVIMCFADF